MDYKYSGLCDQIEVTLAKIASLHFRLCFVFYCISKKFTSKFVNLQISSVLFFCS